MKIQKLIVVLACLLIASSAAAEDPQPPDLCVEPVRGATGEPYADQNGRTISRFCAPRVNPAVLDQEVCCSIGQVASCKPPDAVGRCTSGMKFWCEYGENIGGKIQCYQDGPSTCAAGFCKVPGSYTGDGAIFEDSSWVCCDTQSGECVYVGEGGDEPPADTGCEASDLTICSWGATNEDGTVDCLG